MTLLDIDEYLNRKINNNGNEIICTFYDLRINNNWSELEVQEFLKLAKNRLENLGYQVYFQGDKFVYNNANRMVQDNEYMVAVK